MRRAARPLLSAAPSSRRIDLDLDKPARIPREWLAIAGASVVTVAGVGAIVMLLSGPAPQAGVPVRVVEASVIPFPKAAPKAEAPAAITADDLTSGTSPAPVVTAAAEAEPLPLDDPRWGKSQVAAATRIAPSDPLVSAFAAPEAGETIDDQADRPDDSVSTAAISEEKPRAARALDRVTKPGLDVGDTGEPQAKPLGNTFDITAPTRKVQVNSDVRMRSRAASGSSVITVVPARAMVDLVDCKSWCEIVYNGKRGFVYKKFVSQGEVAARPASKRTAQNVKPAIEPAGSGAHTSPQVLGP